VRARPVTRDIAPALSLSRKARVTTARAVLVDAETPADGAAQLRQALPGLAVLDASLALLAEARSRSGEAGHAAPVSQPVTARQRALHVEVSNVNFGPNSCTIVG